MQALQASLTRRIQRKFEEASLREPRIWRPTGRRNEEVIELCEGMIDVTAALFNVNSKEMRRTGRTAFDVSRVQQIAMYVSHVVLGLSMAEVGKGFQRELATVLHACHLIEDMRDDRDFDRIIGMTEQVAMAAFRNREAV